MSVAVSISWPSCMIKQVDSISEYFIIHHTVLSCSKKKNDKMDSSKKSHVLKNVSRFKTRYKKIMRFKQCIAQVGMSLCKKRFLKNKQYWA